ncbi:MAG: HPF/RaiA family ribosome-associated protein [Pseudomonadota bacterium]|uniref:HPF/RaiA family ribosome-associated protein n=1 Tax=Polaromonas sp. TaxID=1869339 RepID=UPI0017AF771F|nr:HPF/RaiA family ribosome-associated protein [Polaromonas sp.]MBA3592797.1 HPF/RaiA family ribosome-associated protein [Polaromonas sp.]MDQ3272502.1 HPF/RaiA family ribosome-associated protein [Pseudomonadota bacterium]
MSVIFESRQPWLEQLRGLALRRTRQATRPLDWLAPRARVRVSHVQGAMSGIDKRCEVQLTAEGAGTVVVTSITRDWGSALQSALSRAVRALLRKLQPVPHRRSAIAHRC